MLRAFHVWDYTFPVLATPTRFAGAELFPGALGRVVRAVLSRTPRAVLRLLLPIVPTYLWVATKTPRPPVGAAGLPRSRPSGSARCELRPDLARPAGRPWSARSCGSGSCWSPSGSAGGPWRRSGTPSVAGFARLSWPLLAASLVGVVAALLCAMMTWRTLLADLGSPLPLRPAAKVFFVGQLGKYIPGAVWPVLAQMEMGRDLGVPRPRSAAAFFLMMPIQLGHRPARHAGHARLRTGSAGCCSSCPCCWCCWSPR